MTNGDGDGICGIIRLGDKIEVEEHAHHLLHLVLVGAAIAGNRLLDLVRRVLHDLAPGGGFVFAPIHNIQAFVPPQNIVTMYDTALEHGYYHHSP